jgi:hypothetical protein
MVSIQKKAKKGKENGSFSKGRKDWKTARGEERELKDKKKWGRNYQMHAIYKQIKETTQWIAYQGREKVLDV